MVVRDSSLDAYDEIRGSLGGKQAAVLQLLRGATRPLCNQEISLHLGWPINTVTPRVGELVKRGLVRESGRRLYRPTGKNVLHWEPAS